MSHPDTSGDCPQDMSSRRDTARCGGAKGLAVAADDSGDGDRADRSRRGARRRSRPRRRRRPRDRLERQPARRRSRPRVRARRLAALRVSRRAPARAPRRGAHAPSVVRAPSAGLPGRIHGEERWQNPFAIACGRLLARGPWDDRALQVSIALRSLEDQTIVPTVLRLLIAGAELEPAPSELVISRLEILDPGNPRDRADPAAARAEVTALPGARTGENRSAVAGSVAVLIGHREHTRPCASLARMG